jgi:hypothetical protein
MPENWAAACTYSDGTEQREGVREMPIYRVWVTTHVERPLYVDAEDERRAEVATFEYLSDSATFWPTLPTPWEYADAEDYVDADKSGPHDDMAPGDIRALLAEDGDIGYVIVAESTLIEQELVELTAGTGSALIVIYP